MNIQFLSHFLPAPFIRHAQDALFSFLRLKWTLVTGIGLEVRSRTDWTLYNDIFVDGEYDEAIHSLISLLSRRDDALVVDLGANVGFFELRLFHLLSSSGISPKQLRVAAIEPSAANLRELRRRLRQQGEWADCVTIVPGLVGKNKSGTATMFESHNYGVNTIIDDFKYPGARRIAVNFVDLDQVFPKNGPVHLLKCDIEGAELDFVRNYDPFLRRVEIAIFEVHHLVCDVEQLRREIASAGLSRERIIADRGDTSVRLFTRE